MITGKFTIFSGWSFSADFADYAEDADTIEKAS
jgi:hypothetical protein